MDDLLSPQDQATLACPLIRTVGARAFVPQVRSGEDTHMGRPLTYYMSAAADNRGLPTDLNHDPGLGEHLLGQGVSEGPPEGRGAEDLSDLFVGGAVA